MFWAMKLYLAGWYVVTQKSNPLFEAPMWAWPLIGGIDVAFCFALALGYRAFAAAVGRLWPKRGERIAGVAAWFVGAGIILFAVISLVVNQTYSFPLSTNLLRWADDPRVFYSSLFDYAGLVPTAMVLAGWGLQRPLGRLLERGLARVRMLRGSVRLWGAFFAAAIVFGGLWQKTLGGMDMLGVKHNAVVYFIRHWEPANKLGDARLLADELAATAQPWDDFFRRPVSLHSPTTRPRDFDAKTGTGGVSNPWNFILIQLESTSAAHINAQTMPNLMRLASHGVSFQNHFTVFARTDVATYSLYHSDYLCDLQGRMRAFYGRDLPQPSLADCLRKAGYSTAVFHSGFFNFVDMGYYFPKRSFDRWQDANTLWDGKEKLPWSWGVREEKTVDALLGWIDQCPADRPFMAIYATMYPHHPYWSPVEPSPFPKDSWLDRYRNALWYVDQSIGRLADHLERTGRLDRTVLVIYGDHGESVSDYPVGHGIRMTNEELKTPLIISNPRLFPKGQQSQAWTNHLDVAPTVAALAGVAPSPDWLGRNLLADTFEPRLMFLSLNFARTELILDNGVIHAQNSNRKSSTLYRAEGDRLDVLPAGDPAQQHMRRYEEIRAAFEPWATWSHARRAAQ